jgi:ABC-type phosphate/phosphonate transport system substrate-binding protein
MMSAVKRVGMLLITAGVGSLLLPPPKPAVANPGPGGVVHIGLVRSLFREAPPSMIGLLSRPLKALMESQTGLTGELVLAGDYSDLSARLKDGRAQLGVFHGIEFAWARQKNPGLRPLVIAVSQHRLLHAHLVVRKDGGVRSCADLKGKVVALPRMSREHCHLYLERRCPGGGTDPAQFFGQITHPSSADDALGDVVDGLAQAAVVDRIALDEYQRARPARANQLRVLHQSEPFPAAVVAYQAGSLDDTTLRRFRDGMTGADKMERGKQLLKMCRITRFEDVPGDYNRLLEDIARAYPAAQPSK